MNCSKAASSFQSGARSSIRDSDRAFEARAYLASILTAMSAIKTLLGSEVPNGKKLRLVDPIGTSGLDPQLVQTLNELRVYRNRWVHVNEPREDEELLNSPEDSTRELEVRAYAAVKALRRLVYSEQWV